MHAHRIVALAAIMGCIAAAQAAPPTPAARPGAPRAPKLRGADDLMAELEGATTLRFVDAVRGTPIEGAEVTFEGEGRTTNEDGSVRFPTPAGLGADERVFVATFAKKGYVRASIPVRFVAGALFFNRISVSPSLPADKLRIVVDWAEAPRDLDAHLVKEKGWHISFHDMRKFEDRAWLDRDCMSGSGPETITVARVDENARYSYFVHDYSNRGNKESTALGGSKAVVRVFGSEGLLKSFDVPPALKGDTWEVFRFENGAIR